MHPTAHFTKLALPEDFPKSVVLGDIGGECASFEFQVPLSLLLNSFEIDHSGLARRYYNFNRPHVADLGHWIFSFPRKFLDEDSDQAVHKKALTLLRVCIAVKIVTDENTPALFQMVSPRLQVALCLEQGLRSISPLLHAEIFQKRLCWLYFSQRMIFE